MSALLLPVYQLYSTPIISPHMVCSSALFCPWYQSSYGLFISSVLPLISALLWSVYQLFSAPHISLPMVCLIALHILPLLSPILWFIYQLYSASAITIPLLWSVNQLYSAPAISPSLACLSALIRPCYQLYFVPAISCGILLPYIGYLYSTSY